MNKGVRIILNNNSTPTITINITTARTSNIPPTNTITIGRSTNIKIILGNKTINAIANVGPNKNKNPKSVTLMTSTTKAPIVPNTSTNKSTSLGMKFQNTHVGQRNIPRGRKNTFNMASSGKGNK